MNNKENNILSEQFQNQLEAQSTEPVSLTWQ
jgi:hypothetical protein